MPPPCPLPDFAVFDTETTGLYPERGDRVLELAILRMRPDGTEVARYETLLNPDRPVGATHIHGITAADVRDAPAFADVAADALPLLSGCVLVAHNAAFDFAFLEAECRHAGLAPGDPFRLCTVLASRRFCAGLPSHRLAAVCSRLQVPLSDAHSAMADCTATAAIFLHFLRKMQLADPADLRACGAEGTHVFPTLAAAHPARPAYTRAMARRPPPDPQLMLPF
jgi:DNA polymerase-3 subunit epsilon